MASLSTSRQSFPRISPWPRAVAVESFAGVEVAREDLAGLVVDRPAGGGHNERSNLEVVKTILKALGKGESLIGYVKDRLGHDRRYAIDPHKLETELGWNPQYNFDTGITQTIRWNQENQDWIHNVESGEYLRWMERYKD